LPSSLASFAADSLQTRITCDLRKPGRWGARPAMSSRFLCIGGIIAKFTAVGMKPNGGGMLGLIRWLLLAPSGWEIIQQKPVLSPRIRLVEPLTHTYSWVTNLTLAVTVAGSDMYLGEAS
jgi:hypothetical protein